MVGAGKEVAAAAASAAGLVAGSDISPLGHSLPRSASHRDSVKQSRQGGGNSSGVMCPPHPFAYTPPTPPPPPNRLDRCSSNHSQETCAAFEERRTIQDLALCRLCVSVEYGALLSGKMRNTKFVVLRKQSSQITLVLFHVMTKRRTISMEIEKSIIILYEREQKDNNYIISSFNGNK